MSRLENGQPGNEPQRRSVMRTIAVEAESKLGIPVSGIVVAVPDMPGYIRYPVLAYLAYRLVIRGPQDVVTRVIERRRENGENSDDNRPQQ